MCRGVSAAVHRSPPVPAAPARRCVTADAPQGIRRSAPEAGDQGTRGQVVLDRWRHRFLQERPGAPDRAGQVLMAKPKAGSTGRPPRGGVQKYVQVPRDLRHGGSHRTHLILRNS